MSKRIVPMIFVVLLVIWWLLPSESDRLVSRAVNALNEGDLEAVGGALDELAQITADSIDLSAIVSLRVALSVAQVVRDAQLSMEYEAITHVLAENEQEPEPYPDILRNLQTSRLEHQEQLMAHARNYHGQHYHSGLRLTSPLNGTLDLYADDPTVTEAYRDILAGIADSDDHGILRDHVARETVAAVLRLVIDQGDAEDPEKVRLSGSLDLAELWWLIAANSTNQLFSETALDIVLEETEGRPEHPARDRALEALRHFGRAS